MDDGHVRNAAAVAAEVNGWSHRAKARVSPPPWESPIGGEGDERVAALLDAIRADPPTYREAVAAALDHGGADVLAAIARRLSALAVRRCSRTDLERAALALAVAIQGTADRRDVLVDQPVVAHSARLIGEDPRRLYLEVAGWAPALGAAFLRDLAPDATRSATAPLAPAPGRKVGGYVEGVGADGGFAYLPAPRRSPDPAISAHSLNRAGASGLSYATEAAIPHSFDQSTSNILGGVDRLTADGKKRLAHALDAGGRATLTTFARRAAEQAVREGKPGQLARALQALGLALAADPGDARAKAALAFPWSAAQRLGVDPKLLVEEAAVWAPPPAGDALRRFAAKEPDLAATGFVEGADEDGFRFVRGRGVSGGRAQWAAGGRTCFATQEGRV